MLDWKILAASFVALLLVSSLVIGSESIKGFFSDISQKLGEWLGTSPLGGMFAAQDASAADTVELRIRPETFTIRPDQPVRITFDGSEIAGFTGDIIVDYVKADIVLDESTSKMNITLPIGNVLIHDLEINKLQLSNTNLEISSGDWEIASGNGSVEIYDFSGFGSITPAAIELKGNVTKLVRL